MTRPAPGTGTARCRHDAARPRDGNGQEPGGSDPQITPEHACNVLVPRGLTGDEARRFGLYSVTTADELPEPFQWAGEAAVPALVIPWRTLSGQVVPQLRPDVPVVVEGKERKYLLPKGCGSVIGVVQRDDDSDLVVFAEGTFQARAAASYLPAGSVYALAGCRNWSTDGVPVEDLSVVEGCRVVVIFDGDVASNRAVWTAARMFGRALALEGASSIRYVVLPTSGTAGLDDLLGKRSTDRRAAYLDRLISGASEKLPPKPRPSRRRPGRSQHRATGRGSM